MVRRHETRKIQEMRAMDEDNGDEGREVLSIPFLFLSCFLPQVAVAIIYTMIVYRERERERERGLITRTDGEKGGEGYMDLTQFASKTV